MVAAAAIVVSIGSIVVPHEPAIEAHLLARQGGAKSAPPQAPASRGGQRADAAVPFHVGETLNYDILLSSFLVAGTASTSVTARKPAYNSTAYSLVAEGKPIAAAARLLDLQYRLDTLLDTVTLLADEGIVSSDTGKGHDTATTRFDRAGRKAVFERNRTPVERFAFAVPARTQDGLGMLYALRTAALTPGAHLEVPLTTNGALFTVAVEIARPEQVRVPLGTFDAIPLKLTITGPSREEVGRDLAIWISTDARRLPVKLQAELSVGSFALALREAK